MQSAGKCQYWIFDKKSKSLIKKNYPIYEQLISNNLSFFNDNSSFKETKDKCSETNTYYDIENIKKLLKSMTELKTSLFSKLTEEEKNLAIDANQNPLSSSLS